MTTSLALLGGVLVRTAAAVVAESVYGRCGRSSVAACTFAHIISGVVLQCLTAMSQLAAAALVVTAVTAVLAELVASGPACSFRSTGFTAMQHAEPL
jgi:sulfur transfer protein SufE